MCIPCEVAMRALPALVLPAAHDAAHHPVDEGGT